MNESYVSAIESCGWSIYDEGDSIELYQMSPAGEDFEFSVLKENFVEDVLDYAESFDVDEHVIMWIHAKENGVKGVPDVSTLLDDAKDISKMLMRLARKLGQVERAGQMPENLVE